MPCIKIKYINHKAGLKPKNTKNTNWHIGSSRVQKPSIILCYQEFKSLHKA